MSIDPNGIYTIDEAAEVTGYGSATITAALPLTSYGLASYTDDTQTVRIIGQHLLDWLNGKTQGN